MEQFCSTYFSTLPATWKFRDFTLKCPIPKGDKKALEQAWQEKLRKIVQEDDGPRKKKANHLLKRIKQADKILEPSEVCPINQRYIFYREFWL